MTSERAQAYGRVVKTLDELSGVKLLPAEQDRIRAAADTLLFCESVDDPGAREALADVEALASHLVDTGRWTEESARRLADDLYGCGPALVLV
jgi:hypothetical protein